MRGWIGTVITGVLLIVGALSGLVLKGTDSSAALGGAGLFVLIIGIIQAIRSNGGTGDPEVAATASADPHAPPGSSPRPELNTRTIIVGLFVAAVVGGAYPYIVLKLGFGPTMSVVAAFMAFVGLNLVVLGSRIVRKVFKLAPANPTNRYEYNIVQTAGTSAAQAAFMCVVLAAFDLLASKPELGFTIQPSPGQVFLWMTVSGLLGVLLAVPLRRYYIDEEKLTFADGTAAGESLVVLDSNTPESRKQVKVLGLAALIAAVHTFFRDGMPALFGKLTHGLTPEQLKPENLPGGAKLAHLLSMPENTFLSEATQKLNIGINWSLLSLGSGMLVGLRITISMGIGMTIAWFIVPEQLVANQIIGSATYKETLRWVMWPATGMLVASGLTALALKWKLIAKSMKEMATGKIASGGDFPIKWVAIGSGVLSVILMILQWFSLGVAPWMTLIAILVSIVLMVVGIRVLGETNWAPISSMANMVQALFAIVAPGNVGVNMVASGMSGSVAGSGETLMQDYKAGKLIGSSNRALTFMQLIATPIGAAAIAIIYPILRKQYGIGPDRFGLDPARVGDGGTGLVSPISMKWAGFAEILMGGIDKLPRYSFHALAIFAVLGIGIAIFEEKHKKYLPSPTGIALGMLIPALYVLPMLVGGLIQYGWNKASPKQEEQLNTPLASGLIVGEALLALIVTMLVFFGVLGMAGGGH